MIESEANLERILSGLPSIPVEVPDSLLIAYKDGRIKHSDLVPNLYATISAEYRVPQDDVLTGQEEIIRIQAMSEIARQTIEVSVGLDDASHPWQF